MFSQLPNESETAGLVNRTGVESLYSCIKAARFQLEPKETASSTSLWEKGTMLESRFWGSYPGFFKDVAGVYM